MLQLVGGALGLGVWVAVYGTASRHAASYLLAGLTLFAQSQHVITHGIATAFGFAAILNVCSLLVIITLIRTKRLAPAPGPTLRPQGNRLSRPNVPAVGYRGHPAIRRRGRPVPAGHWAHACRGG